MNTVKKAASFLPTTLIHWIEEGRLIHQFPAVVAFADASGFTAMSEKLASIGKEGAETLTLILNSYFTAMISRIECNGGFVGKFGGDAMTIFFPAKSEADLPDVARRATATSLELQSAMGQFQNLKTKAGNFTLGMKVGVAAGNVLFQVVGPSDIGREFLLAGQPLDEASEAEHHGTSGEVILTSMVAELCGECGGEVLEDGFVKLITGDKPPSYKVFEEKEDEIDEADATLAKAFIDPPVYNRLHLGLDSVGEIRRVSVIFMSFSGLDYDEDSDVTDKLDAVYNWVYGLTQRYNGSINKVDMGDKGSKMILTFGTPTAHENDEQHAVFCGMELVKGKDEFSKWGLQWKLGISTGVVFAGEVGAPSRQEYTVMGSSVNLSARLMAKSEPGHLLVDVATYNRTSDFFEYSDPIKHQFKGISKPLPTFEPLGIKAKTSQVEFGIDKPIIGRDTEMQEITSSIMDVLDQHLRVLVIKGTAGIGKSRLSQEALRSVNEKGFRTAGGEALSYAKQSPYLIWISILRDLIGLSTVFKAEDNLSQLEVVVKEVDPEHTFRTPIIASLLGITCPENEFTQNFDAQLRQENMYDFLVQYFKYITAKTPVAFFFEDSQWIDRNSLELIAYLLRNLSDYPILFVIIRRSYGRDFTSPYINEIEKSDVAKRISVSEFDKDISEKFALSCLGANSINTELIDFMFDASHGNASFTEELINNLKNLGNIKLIPEVDGTGIRAEKEGDLSDVEVPDSLNSLIMSQLDRLGTEAKLTVTIAAVIGRRFSEEVVKRAYPVDIDPEAILKSVKELSIQELVNSISDAELFNYIFKNLLTRDVAYDSLLFAHRRDYHNRVGLCLEEMFSDSINERCEELGRHFYQSEDNERAVKYLKIAGSKSYDLYANESAASFFTMAYKRAVADQNLEDSYWLLKMRSKVYGILGMNDQFKNDLDEAFEIANKQGDLKKQVNILDDQASYYKKVADLETMNEVLDRALEVLKHFDYPRGRINLKSKMGQCFFLQNKFKEGLEYLLEALDEAESVNDTFGQITALTNVGLTYKSLGYLDKALDYYNRSVVISQDAGNKKSEAVNLGNIGVLHHQRGDFDKALEAYKQAYELSYSIGWKEVQTRNLGNLAVIYQRQGERQRAINTYQEKLSIEKVMGYRRGQISTLGNIGRWYADGGDYSTAISYCEQVLEIARDLGLRAEETQWMLNIGQYLHRSGDLDEARDTLEQAVRASVEVKYKLAEDYARRYLGFVLIDIGEFEQAETEFNTAFEIAKTLGNKIGLASAKVGLGWISLLRDGDEKPLEDGIAEAKSAKDPETYIMGQIALVRILLEKGEKKDELLEILKNTLGVAKRAGMLRDVNVIEPMIADMEDK
ncbi:MAG: tetratricopeptide repeat protein [Candidatus Hatepunaea meridiana]|nr:tetratricopeptide repeat protein [Candidatus Hatepunaea meridiana]